MSRPGYGEPRDPLDDPPATPSLVTQELVRQIVERDVHGQAKYNATLDRTDLTLSQWLQHMAEELMDGAGYALAAKRTRETELLAIVERAKANYQCYARFVSEDHSDGFRAGVNAFIIAIRKEMGHA